MTDLDIKRKIGSVSEESEVVRAGKEVKGLVRPVQGLVKKEEKEVILTANERAFLIDIAKNPISGVVARYTRLGLNRYQGNKIQKELLEKNLIYWKPISTQKARLKVLVLTDKGKKAIPDVKIEKIFNKKGSWEHEYWKFMVGEYFKKKGYIVMYEYNIGEGKPVDVVAEKDGKRNAIEVETGKSDSIYNIRKDLEAGFDEVVVVALDEKTKKKIMESNYGRKIEILKISELNLN